MDFSGVMPATVTPFSDDGSVDYESLHRLGIWLSRIPGVTGVVCNGHAGEGSSLSYDERVEVIRALRKAVGNDIAVISGVIDEGTALAADEAKRAEDAGADAILVYPPHGWLRFGYQKQAPVDRYRTISGAVTIPLVLFQYPDATKASYSADTIMEICRSSNVVAIKNGVRNMARWDQEVPRIRAELPGVKMLTCQDEYLLHTMWDSDGSVIGYACLIPELMVTLQQLAHEGNYYAARKVYESIGPLTAAVYHRDNHLEGTVALKIGLVARGLLATSRVRSPLFDLDVSDKKLIEEGLAFAGAGLVELNELPDKQKVNNESEM